MDFVDDAGLLQAEADAPSGIKIIRPPSATNSAFTSFEDLFTKTPLYTRIDPPRKVYMQLATGEIIFDGYCCLCKKNGPFRSASRAPAHFVPEAQTVSFPRKDGSTHEDIIREFNCGYNPAHVAIFIFRTSSAGVMRKIGQDPSLYDFACRELEEYSQVLDKRDLRDLGSAIRQVANGHGTGGFVYLRRIFEKLIKDSAREAAEADPASWDEAAFNAPGMEGKIEKLRSYLPEFLLSHKKLYGLLSEGIHEMSEEECLNLFEVVRAGVVLILDERVARKKRDKHIAQVSKNLQALL